MPDAAESLQFSNGFDRGLGIHIDGKCSCCRDSVSCEQGSFLFKEERDRSRGMPWRLKNPDRFSRVPQKGIPFLQFLFHGPGARNDFKEIEDRSFPVLLLHIFNPRFVSTMSPEVSRRIFLDWPATAAMVRVGMG